MILNHVPAFKAVDAGGYFVIGLLWTLLSSASVMEFLFKLQLEFSLFQKTIWQFWHLQGWRRGSNTLFCSREPFDGGRFAVGDRCSVHCVHVMSSAVGGGWAGSVFLLERAGACVERCVRKPGLKIRNHNYVVDTSYVLVRLLTLVEYTCGETLVSISCLDWTLSHTVTPRSSQLCEKSFGDRHSRCAVGQSASAF